MARAVTSGNLMDFLEGNGKSGREKKSSSSAPSTPAKTSVSVSNLGSLFGLSPTPSKKSSETIVSDDLSTIFQSYGRNEKVEEKKSSTTIQDNYKSRLGPMINEEVGKLHKETTYAEREPPRRAPVHSNFDSSSHYSAPKESNIPTATTSNTREKMLEEHLRKIKKQMKELLKEQEDIRKAEQRMNEERDKEELALLTALEAEKEARSILEKENQELREKLKQINLLLESIFKDQKGKKKKKKKKSKSDSSEDSDSSSNE